MSQQYHIGTTATKIKTKPWLHKGVEEKAVIVTYHDTDVVIFTDRVIMLDSGGWMTNTTKTRMNQASNQYALGYRVFQKDYRWFVTHYFTKPEGETIPFTDQMLLYRDTKWLPL